MLLPMPIDEYVVSAAWCVRAGKFGDDGLRVVKAIRRWTAQGDHPADRAPAWNVFALTPQRVVVFVDCIDEFIALFE